MNPQKFSQQFSQTLLQSLVLGTIASFVQSPIAVANSQPYPERMIRSLIEVCMKPKVTGVFIPFAIAPKAGETKPEKTIAMVIEEYQSKLHTSLKQEETERTQVEKALREQVDERLAQMKEQLKDKARLAQELQQIQTAIKTGSFNGQKLSDEEITQLKQTEADLNKISQDPKYVEVMAKAAYEQEVSALKKRSQETIRVITQQKANLEGCGCTIEALQKRYSLDEVGDRVKQDILGKPGIRQELEASSQSCKAAKSN